MHLFIKPHLISLYQVIYQLSNVKGYCWATNKKLSTMIRNSSTRTITRGINELELEGFITVEGEGKARRIRITGKIAEFSLTFDEDPTQTNTSMLDELNVDKNGDQHRQILQPTWTNTVGNVDKNDALQEDETGLTALDGKPSQPSNKVLLNNNKEIKNKLEESEAKASLSSDLSFEPIVVTKKKRSYTKRKGQSHLPLTEDEIKLQEELKVLFASEVFRPAWELFVRHRKTMKAPLTRDSANLTLKELLKLSGSNPIKAVAVLNQTVMNGWKGLFPVKDDKVDKTRKNSGWLDPSLDNRPERKLKVIDLGNDDEKINQ